MHDTAALEKRGLPAVALISSGFAPQAEYQALSLGIEACRRLFVQHPISDATPAEIAAKADRVYDQVVSCLTTDEIPAPFAAPAAGPAPAGDGEDC